MGAIKQLLIDVHERFYCGDADARDALIELGDPLGLTQLSATLDVVTDYYERGFSVVPQRPGAKAPCISWKQYQKTQPTVIECFEWWHREWPDAGVAIILGPVSDLFVIDVDGEAAHKELIHRLGRIPDAPQVMSGSGDPHRFHLFFQHPNLPTKAKFTPWHPNLEFRGQGGIVIAPPSKHKSGNRYRFAEGRSIDDIPLAPVPEVVLEALKQEASRRSRRPAGFQAKQVKIPQLHNLSRNTREFLEGKFASGPEWNARLFKAACDMAGNGYTQLHAEPLLIAGAQPWNSNELEAVAATIRSAFSQSREPARKPSTKTPNHKSTPQIKTVVRTFRITE